MALEHPIGLADLLRASERLGADTIAACTDIAAALGLAFAPPSQARDSGATVPPPTLPEHTPGSAAGAQQPAPAGLNEIEFEISVSKPTKPAPQTATAYVAAASPLPPDALHTAPPVELASLFAPRLTRDTLRRSLSVPVADGPPDLTALVDRLSRGEPLTQIPRLNRLSLRYGVQILCDSADAMLPFASDQRALIAQIEQLVGVSLVEVVYFDGFPDKQLSDTDEAPYRNYQPPAPGTPILLLSDLGIGRPPNTLRPASVHDWRRWAVWVREAGCPVLAYIPYRATRWPHQLRDVIEMHHWDRPLLPPAATGVDVPATADEADTIAMLTRLARRNPGAVELARILSVAARIEPELMRAARIELLPDVDAGAEADLLFSELIEAHSPEATVLLPSAADRLRRELCADAALRLRTQTFLKRYREQQQSPQTLRLEETISLLACEDAVSTETLEQILAPAVKSLIDPNADNAGLAHWALSAASRFPPQLRGSNTAKELRLAARLRVGRRAIPATELPDDLDAIDWLLPEALPRVPVGVRWTEQGLRFTDPAPGGQRRIEVPDTQPRILQLEIEGATAVETHRLGPQTTLDVPAPRTPLFIRTIDGRLHELTPHAEFATRVLWVDDEPHNNDAATRALKERRIGVIRVVSTDAALEAIQQGPFDAIITDQLRHEHGTRNDQAGYALLRQLREKEVTAPVLLSTAQPDEAEAQRLGFFGTARTQEEVVALVLKAIEQQQQVPEPVLSACVQVETLGAQAGPVTAFAVAGQLLVTAAAPFRGIPFLGINSDDMPQVEVLNADDSDAEVAVLRVVGSYQFQHVLMLADGTAPPTEAFGSEIPQASEEALVVMAEASGHRILPATLYRTDPQAATFGLALHETVPADPPLGAPILVDQQVVGIIVAGYGQEKTAAAQLTALSATEIKDTIARRTTMPETESEAPRQDSWQLSPAQQATLLADVLNAFALSFHVGSFAKALGIGRDEWLIEGLLDEAQFSLFLDVNEYIYKGAVDELLQPRWLDAREKIQDEIPELELGTRFSECLVACIDYVAGAAGPDDDTQTWIHVRPEDVDAFDKDIQSLGLEARPATIGSDIEIHGTKAQLRAFLPLLRDRVYDRLPAYDEANLMAPHPPIPDAEDVERVMRLVEQILSTVVDYSSALYSTYSAWLPFVAPDWREVRDRYIELRTDRFSPDQSLPEFLRAHSSYLLEYLRRAAKELQGQELPLTFAVDAATTEFLRPRWNALTYTESTQHERSNYYLAGPADDLVKLFEWAEQNLQDALQRIGDEQAAGPVLL